MAWKCIHRWILFSLGLPLECVWMRPGSTSSRLVVIILQMEKVKYNQLLFAPNAPKAWQDLVGNIPFHYLESIIHRIEYFVITQSFKPNATQKWRLCYTAYSFSILQFQGDSLLHISCLFKQLLSYFDVSWHPVLSPSLHVQISKDLRTLNHSQNMLYP